MKKLQSPIFIAALLGLILLFNTKGVLEQYMECSGETEQWQWVYNAIALLALDVAVFIFALRGMKSYAIAYAAAILLVNFRPLLLIEDWATWNLIVSRITLGIIRLAFAGGIFIFSEIFAEGLRKSEISPAENVKKPVKKTTTDSEKIHENFPRKNPEKPLSEFPKGGEISGEIFPYSESEKVIPEISPEQRKKVQDRLRYLRKKGETETEEYAALFAALNQ